MHEDHLWEEALSTERACSGVRMEDAGPFAGQIALTFDDGPHPTHTPEVMNYLRGEGIPATFFVLGEKLESSTGWAIAEEIHQDPLFDLANHSYAHSDMRNVSNSTLVGEVDSTDSRIRTTGANPHFFRFPYGASTCGTRATVEDLGHRVAGWHIDSMDWCYATRGGSCTGYGIPSSFNDDMIGYIVSQARRNDGGVLLLHDVHGWTADMLPTLIETLRAEGFSFVPLQHAGLFPQLNGVDTVRSPFLGESCEVDNDQCGLLDPNAFCLPVSDNAPQGVCSKDCEGYCPDHAGSSPTYCATTASGGMCLAKSHDRNDQCAAIPGTSDTLVERFIGTSTAAASEGMVCMPDWQ